MALNISTLKSSSKEYNTDSVNWYPWNENTFEIAKAQNKPVFLHIYEEECLFSKAMAEKCFSDVMVIKLLNRDYISIRIEKNSFKQIYDFASCFSVEFHGKTAMPLNVFFTPNKAPFYVISYMERFPKCNFQSFVDLLHEITFLWKYSYDDIQKTAAAYLPPKEENAFSKPTGFIVKDAFEYFSACFDTEFGGFGVAPKFPMPHQLLFLLKYYKTFHDENALYMSSKTLSEMYLGALFDHVGGGFFRFSYDDAWEKPCLEKTLTDNAILLYAYSYAYSITQKADFEYVIKKTTDFILNMMQSNSGAFYTKTFLQTDNWGKHYYQLTKNELELLLKKENSESFCKYFCINDSINDIPRINRTMKKPLNIEDMVEKVGGYRKSRGILNINKTSILAHNGLMILALAKAFSTVGVYDALIGAVKNHTYIKNNMWHMGKLLHDNGEKNVADASDIACYALGLLELYSATKDDEYLNDAEFVATQIQRDDYDEVELQLNNKKRIIDGEIPSKHSITALLFLRLAQFTHNPNWESLARKQLSFLTASIGKPYTAHAFGLFAMLEDYTVSNDKK